MKVFMFHDVYNKDSIKWLNDKFYSRYNIRGLILKEDFENKIKYLIENYKIISIDQYYNKNYDDNIFDNLAILTFDDGLKDNYINVLPILKKYNIKATFFISARPLIENKILDVHKIQFLIANEDFKLKEIFDFLGNKTTSLWEKYSISKYENNTWNKRDIFLTNIFRNIEYKEILDNLFQKYVLEYLNISEKKFVENFYLSLEELKELKKDNQIIGCHGYYHNSLDNKKNIIKTDIYLKENNLFSPYFSYPNGNIYSIDYKLAFSTEERTCKMQENKLLIPRFNCANINNDKKLAMFGIQKQGLEIIQFLINKGINFKYLITINEEKAKKINSSGWVDYKDFCQKNNIKLYHCDKYTLKSEKDINFFKNNKFDLAILGGWQRLIPEEIINTFKFGIIGQHGSSELLPRCRGRSPVNWSLILGKERLIWNIFFIKPDIDDGNIIDYKNVNINHWDNCKTLYYKISIIVKQMYLENIPKILNNKCESFKQSGEPTFYLQRTPEDGKINWQKSVKEIYNLIRAVTEPYPGAFTYLGPEKIYIWEAYPFDNNIIYQGKKYGEIVEVFNEEYIINCVDGLLLVKRSNLKIPYIGDIYN